MPPISTTTASTAPAGRSARRDRSALREGCYDHGMKFFVKAIVTGFGLSLGSALFKKVQRHLGLGEDKDKDDKSTSEVVKQDGATDPGLQQPRFS
jgi:hypothetical protein